MNHVTNVLMAPVCAHSTADAMSASSKTSNADFPPVSSVTFLRLIAASFITCRPVAVDPVKLSLSTPRCDAIAAPAVRPVPFKTLTTPGGKPAC